MTSVLGRLLVLVSAVVLVDIAFYSAIVPLLPTYTEDLGLSKSEAGVLAGAYAAGTLLASIPAGLVATRIGAKPTLLGGLVLLVASCLAFGFAERYEVLVAARFLQGLGGAASWAAGLAWLVAVAPRERRGELIGTVLGVAIAGALGGPVIGAIAEELGTEIVFGVIAAVAAALALAVATLPRPLEAEPTAGLGAARRDRRELAGAWLTTLPALCLGTITVLSSLRLDHLGVGAAGVGAVFLAAAAVEATMSPIVGRVSDRRGRLVPMRIGLAGILLICIGMPLAERSTLPLAVAVVAAAALTGMLWAPAMALLSDGAEAAGLSQGLAFGLMNLAWAGGQVGGAVGGAAIADASRDSVSFVLLAAFVAVTLIAMANTRVRVRAAA